MAPADPGQRALWLPIPSWPTTFRPRAQNLNYTSLRRRTAPIVPQTTDPAKLALYTADGLTPGSPFPGNVIPANLMDPNALLEVNAGTFPKPNLGNGTSTLPRFRTTD